VFLFVSVTDQNQQHASEAISQATADAERSSQASQGSAIKTGLWVFLILVGVIGMSKLPGPSVLIGYESPARGKPAPAIDLIPLTDTTSLQRLDSLPSGKVVLLHFWGTWCGPCTMEYPDLCSMARQWESSDRFQFLPVSCKPHERETDDSLKRKTLEYFDAAELNSYAYCDPYGLTRQSVAKRLERDGMYYPTTMLIQQDGSIAGVWEGFNEDGVGQMHEAIRYLLNR
jgi:thiol-disulfide isomerase/thioredoxin